MAGRLQNKIAIITGGTGGIGRAIARRFAQEGARVCVADIGQDQCETVAREIGGGAFGCALSIADPDSAVSLVQAVKEKAGGVHIMVNCAGVFGMDMIGNLTQKEFDRIYDVNVRGALNVIQATAMQMIAQGHGGAMVTVSSGAARRAPPANAIYGSSKAAVINITQCAAVELARHGIRVNCIAPGATRTPMWTQVEHKFVDILGTEFGGAEAMQIQTVPMGRIASPEDMAGPALFLCSEDAAYVTGQTLNVDGGANFN